MLYTSDSVRQSSFNEDGQSDCHKNISGISLNTFKVQKWQPQTKLNFYRPNNRYFNSLNYLNYSEQKMRIFCSIVGHSSILNNYNKTVISYCFKGVLPIFEMAS